MPDPSLPNPSEDHSYLHLQNWLCLRSGFETAGHLSIPATTAAYSLSLNLFRINLPLKDLEEKYPLLALDLSEFHAKESKVSWLI